MKKLKVILIGAGGRGKCYTNVMHEMPDKYEVVAVAEPNEERRNYMKEKHGIPQDRCFKDWKPLLALGKIADVALIATMDRDHFAPAMEAIELKYDLLLEKPITPGPEECQKLSDAATRNGVKVVICTVLRYTDVFIKLKELLDSGVIGKVMSINHEECVGNVHQSHSFVRGNWGNEGRSSSMLVQKSCHDMDILQWLIGKRCLKVQSFGKLSYFKAANAPEGAPDYCIQGCPKAEECHYNAVKIYLEDNGKWYRNHAASTFQVTDEEMRRVVTKTQYGKCVYKCDNDVVDHQVVNLLFEDDITVSFTMNAFNKGGRHIHIMGTEGEIHAGLDGKTPIQLYDFATEETKTISLVAQDGIGAGHGGGDYGLVRDLYLFLNDAYEGKSIPDIQESCYSHMITFAAEAARVKETVVDVEEFISQYRQ